MNDLLKCFCRVFFFLAVEEKLVEDADVCITKCVSMIGVIIHSIVFHLKYSIILSSDINKQVNAAIDASCSAQVAVSAPLLYTSTLHLAKCKIGSWKFSFLHPPLSLSHSLILIKSEQSFVTCIQSSHSKFLTQLNFYNFKHEM